MSGPRQEILSLLAEGKISPSEADMLLDALEAGMSEGRDRRKGRAARKPGLGASTRAGSSVSSREASARGTSSKGASARGGPKAGRSSATRTSPGSESAGKAIARTRPEARQPKTAGTKARTAGKQATPAGTKAKTVGGKAKTAGRKPRTAAKEAGSPGGMAPRTVGGPDATKQPAGEAVIPKAAGPGSGARNATLRSEPPRVRFKKPPLPDAAASGADSQLRTASSPGARSESVPGKPPESGQTWDLPPGSILRIGPPRAGAAAPAGIGLRGVPGIRMRLYRGSRAELHAAEAGCYELSWDEGNLILEIPESLGGLEISEIQGKVTLLKYPGPFTIERIAGSLTVGPVNSPFRIRQVGGDVDLDELSVRGGLSTVAEVGGDVRVSATRDASFSVRASSLSGQVAFGRTIALDPGDPGRRRGVWRLGSGAGQLNITGVKGWIRLYQDASQPEGGLP